ncbi:hypothetical protein Y1Q_0023612 [Alligator mississippiensis]|uniref:Uncharacterized protein n=1 Tax=Alligator mississippiensis TaxID=8496 RepID=A0A151MMW7_ALLMI|nr:hypothetical protein Y1Q_0023612 [Alligator mississippiensis]
MTVVLLLTPHVKRERECSASKGDCSSGAGDCVHHVALKDPQKIGRKSPSACLPFLESWAFALPTSTVSAS